MQKDLNKKYLKLIASVFVMFGFSVLAQNASGAPSISGTSGSFSNGQSVTVNGTGFGTKPAAAPIKFDEFENGSNGSYLHNVDTNWHPYTEGDGLTYSNVTSHSGSLSAFNAVTGTGGNFNTEYFTFTPAEDVFYSYWWRTANLTTAMRNNTKMGRINASSVGDLPHYHGIGSLMLSNYMFWSGGDDIHGGANVQYEIVNGGVPIQLASYLSIRANSWLRVDCHKKVSNPAGSSNGAVECWIIDPLDTGNTGYLGNTALVTRNSGESWLEDSILLGTMEGGGRGPYDYQIYIDDVYVDNTLARVELCDSSTWTTRHHCEIQPATTWNSSGQSVVITVNTGTLVSGTAYLYVVDSAGASSNPYSVSVGSSSDITAPANPSGLSVN